MDKTTQVCFEQGGPRYLDASATLVAGAVALFGAPYDGTTSWRPGTRFGPNALRMASDVLETYSCFLDADLSEMTWVDLGDLPLHPGAPGPAVEMISQATAQILAAGAKPLMVGGEHTVTVGAVRSVAAQHEDLVVVQLDAHADLRQAYLGEPLNHACALRRCVDVVGRDAVLQVGIRSGTAEEFQELRQTGRWIAPDGPSLEQALAPVAGRPVYLTLDLDVFDPSVLPGTGTPEPGGITWQVFEQLLSALKPHRIVGADVVELSPHWDPSGRSDVVAAKAVREIALMMGQR